MTQVLGKGKLIVSCDNYKIASSSGDVKNIFYQYPLVFSVPSDKDERSYIHVGLIVKVNDNRSADMRNLVFTNRRLFFLKRAYHFIITFRGNELLKEIHDDTDRIAEAYGCLQKHKTHRMNLLWQC